jgi:hypothetical protein
MKNYELAKDSILRPSNWSPVQNIDQTPKFCYWIANLQNLKYNINNTKSAETEVCKE